MAKRGVTIGGPYASLGALAQQVEAKGFDATWVAETSQDSTIQASVVAQATERTTSGPTSPWRSPGRPR